jgi:hypothetical protein
VVDGYEVDPAALRAASGGFHADADAVGAAARQLATAQLVPGALGEVEAAYELAAAFAEFVGGQSDGLAGDAALVGDTADGLVSSADGYLRAEEPWTR